MKKSSKLTIAKMKSNSYTLRANYQIPLYLHIYILRIDNNTDLDWINYLKEQSFHMLRVKGYYKTYTDIEKYFNGVLKDEYERRYKQ